MTDLSSRSVLVYDKGLFVSLAVRLTEFFGKVYYYSPWKTANIRLRDLQPGSGFSKVTRVKNLFDVIDSVDLLVFPDVADGDLQSWLRDRGRPVWGSGGAEDLELYRWETRDLLEQLNMPVLPATRLIGTTALAEHLQEHNNLWIKLSVIRGECETWHHHSWRLSEPKVLELAHRFGPMREHIEFIAEEHLEDAVEIGFDGWCIDGDFPAIVMQGYEIKDAGLIGAVKHYGDLCEPLKWVNSKLASTLASYHYRGFFSTEVRVTRDGKAYLIDPCCRMGSPPGELYMEMYRNLGEILWHGAQGELVTPDPVAPFGVQLMLYSDWCSTAWMPVYTKPEHARHVKLSFATRIDRKDYVVPQHFDWEKVGSVVAWGDTVNEAIDEAREIEDKVEGFQLTSRTQALDEAQAVIDRGKEFGIEFEDNPVEVEAPA